MSTNTPPRKYGYTLPSLGGKDLGRPNQETDVCWLVDKWTGAFCHHDMSLAFVSHLYYCRPIDVGPEHELVGEDEGISPNCEYTFDGITWLPCAEGANAKVKECVQPPSLIIAIRRRKVVKDEWPKYWECKWLGCVRQLTKAPKFEYYKDGCWLESISGKVGDCDTPITPQRAFELTGDKEILGKRIEYPWKCPKCLSRFLEPEMLGRPGVCPNCEGAGNELAYEPTAKEPDAQGASLCQRCGKPELDFGFCNDCLVDMGKASLAEPPVSPPQWIPVSELLNIPKGTQIILGCWDNHWWITSGTSYPEYERHPRWTHFYQVPPPPQPKTREQEDEEKFTTFWNSTDALGCGSSDPFNIDAHKRTWHAALAYARGEKGEK